MATEETQREATDDRYLDAEMSETLDARHLRTMWDVHEEWGSPETDMEPYVWPWDASREALVEVGDRVALDELEQGLRRSLALCTPGMNITSPTIAVFYQLVDPDEDAGAHRHNVGAFRFVVEGSEDLRTVVEGEAFPMKPGDLVLTPNWTWHDHVNEGDEKGIWIDVLDWPFVGEALKTPVFEQFREFRQPIDKPDGHFNSQFGRMRPARAGESSYPDTPPYRFAWEDCYRTLQGAADSDDEDVYDPYNGFNFEYVNPETGQPPVMSTMSLRLQLLREATASHRHNSTEVFHAVEGSGRTQVGDETLQWDERDTFVVPPGSYHAHEPDDEAVLFAMSDAPIFDAFHLHREETRDDSQLL